MANLKGSTFEKQIKNAKIRIEARGQSRYQKQDLHLTHSNALGLKRDYWLKSFAEYATSLNRDESKLNNYMDNKTISEFLNHKAASLCQKSAINFTRGFSALTDALKSTGVSVAVDKSTFDSHINTIKENKEDKQDSKHRDIQNIKEVIKELRRINPSFAALATIQSKLGLRVSESIKLLANGDYVKEDNMIHGLVGKGNHVYEPKPISIELQRLLNKSEPVKYQSYQNALKTMNISSHQFRFTFVKNRMEHLLNHKSYKEALSIISKEINHVRPSITEYYLSRTSF